MRDLHNPACFANHMGLWAIEETYLHQAVSAIKAGAMPIRAADSREGGAAQYGLTPDGVAVITISGPMTKGASKYSQANTLDLRRAVRAAARDDDVRGIFLHIDSPGGSVAGTQELADDVRAADAVKPVWAYAEDCCCSAAYWVASQARSISVNKSGEVGSIGAIALVYDTSEAAKMEGVKVHVVATGEMKGAGAPGVEVTKKHLAYFQERVDAAFSNFLGAVESGRAHAMTDKALKKVQDARVYTAGGALDLGLVDRIESADQALGRLVADLDEADAKERAARRRARLRRR